MTDRIRVAAVGLGWVTLNRHLPSLKGDPRFEITGVIDRRPGRAQSVAERYGIPHHAEADRLENIPWLGEVDAVTVGTGPLAHHALVKSALAAGKHVLTEKPFTMTVAEGEELVKLAADRKKILAVVHNFQFASSTQKLVSDIAAGRLGKVRSISARQLSNPRRRLPAWYEELPLGLFYDEGPHFLYLLSRLAPGPLKLLRSDVFPSTEGKATPAAVSAKFLCESPAGPLPVTMDMAFETPVSEWHLTVHGEEALGDIDIFRDIYIRLPNDGLHGTASVLRTSLAATAQHWAQHFTSGLKHVTGKLRYGNETVFARFAEAVASGREPDGIGAADALKVLKLQHQIIERRSLLR